MYQFYVMPKPSDETPMCVKCKVRRAPHAMFDGSCLCGVCLGLN
jgi:hypothetical protein